MLFRSGRTSAAALFGLRSAVTRRGFQDRRGGELLRDPFIGRLVVWRGRKPGVELAAVRLGVLAAHLHAPGVRDRVDRSIVSRRPPWPPSTTFAIKPRPPHI